MKENYLKKEAKDFLNSFRLKFNFIQVLLYDLIFYAVFVPAVMLSGWIVNMKGAAVDTARLTENAMETATEAELVALYSQLKGLVFWAIASFVVAAVLALAAWSLSRGLIYAKLLNKKFTEEHFKRMLGLNAVIGFAVILFMLFIAVLLNAQMLVFIILSLIIMLAMAYFIFMIYIEFIKEKKVFMSISKGIEAGAKKLRHLAVPGILIIITGYIISYISGSLPGNILVSLPLFAAFMSWARIYLIGKAEA